MWQSRKNGGRDRPQGDAKEKQVATKKTPRKRTLNDAKGESNALEKNKKQP